jgi:hypothetical protein
MHNATNTTAAQRLCTTSYFRTHMHMPENLTSAHSKQQSQPQWGTHILLAVSPTPRLNTITIRPPKAARPRTTYSSDEEMRISMRVDHIRWE